MRALRDSDELDRAVEGDALLVWAAQGLSDGSGPVRAWRRGDAVAVAHPDLSRRDRLALHGPAPEVAALVRDVLADIGPTYRPVADAALISAVVERVPELTTTHPFWWMDTDQPVTAAVPGHVVRWGSDEAEVSELLRAANPDSYAWPGGTGVIRWAGCQDASGLLAAVGAEAWSAPAVGFLAGIATRPDARGQGLGTAVTAALVDRLVADRGRAALMVDDAARGARRLYGRLGLSERRLLAAAPPG